MANPPNDPYDYKPNKPEEGMQAAQNHPFTCYYGSCILNTSVTKLITLFAMNLPITRHLHFLIIGPLRAFTRLSILTWYRRGRATRDTTGRRMPSYRIVIRHLLDPISLSSQPKFIQNQQPKASH